MEEELTDRRNNTFRLEKSINLGSIFTVIIVLFTLIQMYNGLIARMTKMEDKVDMMWSQFVITMRK